MQSAHDIEALYDKEDIGFDSNVPLLSKSGRGPTKSLQRLRKSLEVIELDDIPPIIKSANGNIFWADELCTRRVGLTATEARLFLKLLQTDVPENYNYDEFKQMFDDFGDEQQRLQGLVDALPWWKLDAHKQKSIWEARIDWLERMREPRLWLLYLMARRRRILKKASMKVLEALKEKRRIKLANASSRRGRAATGQEEPVMLSETTQTSEIVLKTPGQTHSEEIQALLPNEVHGNPEVVLETLPPLLPTDNPTLISEESGGLEAKLRFATRIRESLSASRHKENRSGSSTSQCPAFDKRIEATRRDIKHQVEIIMPQQRLYIVFGWFLRTASDPKERIVQFDNPEHLFRVLRNGERAVRGYRRFLSLKGLRGFGLYKCDISRGAHMPLTLNASQDAVLSQLYLAYRASYRHPDPDVARAWQGWVHRNLNDNKNNPLQGRYSLQLIYDWSSYRLITIFAVPLLLSLAIGFWYMNGHGDVVTAWTLALYVVTAAAALIALMTIIGSLKDI